MVDGWHVFLIIDGSWLVVDIVMIDSGWKTRLLMADLMVQERLICNGVQWWLLMLCLMVGDGWSHSFSEWWMMGDQVRYPWWWFMELPLCVKRYSHDELNEALYNQRALTPTINGWWSLIMEPYKVSIMNHHATSIHPLSTTVDQLMTIVNQPYQ